MANYHCWLSFVFLLICVLYITCHGADIESPDMTDPPLLKYGNRAAGDEEVDSFVSAHQVKLDFNVSYFGSSYSTIYISSDGIISFMPNVKFLERVSWSEGIRNPVADKPFMAPFYHQGYDPVSQGHELYQGKLFYRVIYKDKLETEEATVNSQYSHYRQTLNYFTKYVQEAVIHPPKDFQAEVVIVVTWSDVTDNPSSRDPECEATSSDPCKSATFQAVIVADKMNTFVVFNYLKMEIPYNPFYQTGFNGGYGRGWFNVIPCHGECSLNLNNSRVNDLPTLHGSDMQGRFVLDVGGEEIIRGGCLPSDLRAGMLEVYPREVGMFGGEKLEVSGKCLPATSPIYCRFGSSSDSPVTSGVMSNGMKGYCPVPLMTMRGPVMVSWSSDGEDWSAAQKFITVILPDQAKEQESVSYQDKVAWYSRDASSITVSWSSDTMSTNDKARVEVKLIGYREIDDQVEFKELENFGDTDNSAGKFSFDTAEHACVKDCEDFEMGLLEVSLVKNYYDDASHRVAFRFGPIPLGWYVNEQLKEDLGSDWSNQMCHRWNKEDRKSSSWFARLETCPCSLDQVLADFGRWQADPSCDLYRDSVCLYHKGAKHCVRSVQTTPEGAGNQCCYNRDGTLSYSQLTYQGSTPDRAHPWGSYPYNAPNRVPTLSHWRHDVIPFYYCCLWEDDHELCEEYVTQRPTTDCAYYQVPGLATVRGDPHITTFDGQTYNFGGKGDFWLLNTGGVEIQGRFEPHRGSWDLGKMRQVDRTSWKPTALTSVTIQGKGVIVEIRPAPTNAIYPRGLDIHVGNERYFFLTEKTKIQDIGGQTIMNNALNMHNNPHNNFTVFTRSVGINVVAVNDLLHVTVVIPPTFKKFSHQVEGMGLLGMFDGNGDNDYVSASNTISSPGKEPRKLYTDFGMSWAVDTSSSLFLIPKAAQGPTEYTPYYKYEDIPHSFSDSPSDALISSLCEKNKNCQWDYRITGSRAVAEATKKADKLFSYSQGSAYLVESCGLPDVGHMAILNKYNFSVGQEITVTDCGEGHSFSGQAAFTCVQERLDIAKEEERADYGRRVTDKQVDYIIHWVPQPSPVCHESHDEESKTAMYIGIAVGVVVIIIITVIIVVLLMRRKQSKQSLKPRPADRVRKGAKDGETDEPMLSTERNPVYKPSRGSKQASSEV